MKNVLIYLLPMFAVSSSAQDTACIKLVQQAAIKIVQLRDSVSRLDAITKEYATVESKYRSYILSDSVETKLLKRELAASNNIIARYESADKGKWYDSKTVRFYEGFILAIAAVFVATRF